MKKLLTAFAMALLLVGCAKEYNDKELRDRVTTLETKVGNLEAQMLVAQKVALGEFVQKVEEVEDGLTITYGDGTVLTVHVSTGSGAGTLSVLKNAAGDLCWAIDGTILQYEGKDLVVGAVSNISVQDGKLFAVINGEAKELGGFSGGSELKDGIFTGVELTGEAVVLTLSDGSKINIPLAKAFKLVIANTQYAVTTTDAFDVEYTVQAKTANTVVDIFTDANYEAEVQADKFVITPKAVVKGSALAYADSQVGLTSIVKLSFGSEGEADSAEITDEPYSADIDYMAEAADGVVEAHIVANVSLNAESFRPTVDWISVKEVKATNYILTLELEDNLTDEIRTGAVEIYPAGAEKPIQTITIAQKAGEPDEPDQPTGTIKALYWGNKDNAVWYKNFPAAISLPNGYSMTIHFYYDTAKKQRLCNFGDASEAPCNMLRFGEQTDRNNELEWMVDTGSGRIKVYADGAEEGKWNAITVTAGANGYVTYMNGTKKNSNTEASYRQNTSFQAFEFADSWGDRGAFDGAIAYVSLWDKQLSDEEVAANVFKKPSGDGLKLFWAMTEGQGYFLEETAGKVSGDYAIDFTECKRKNGSDVEGSADVSNTIEWKEYPAIKAPVAAE